MKKIILLIVVVIILFSLIFWKFGFEPVGMFLASKDKFSNDVEDKCEPTPGDTEESWKEHMSHHPDMYKECL